jgi:tRNA-dihydrouridine synthase B
MHPDNFKRAVDIITAAVTATHLPVTLKMRLGWDDESHNGDVLAKIAEDLGIKMITVHGRTRCQFYNGVANWHAIAKIRNATTLPLIVNGDIIDTNTAKQALYQSGADGIMIGRASCGKPWLLQAIKSELQNGTPSIPPSFTNQINDMIMHYTHIIQFYGEKSGLRIGRKHLHWYRESLGLDDSLSDVINKADNSHSVLEKIIAISAI